MLIFLSFFLSFPFSSFICFFRSRVCFFLSGPLCTDFAVMAAPSSYNKRSVSSDFMVFCNPFSLLVLVLFLLLLLLLLLPPFLFLFRLDLLTSLHHRFHERAAMISSPPSPLSSSSSYCRGSFVICFIHYLISSSLAGKQGRRVFIRCRKKG